jgi:hypothetical protein
VHRAGVCRLGVTLAAAVGAALFCGGPAWGLTAHVFSLSFGGAGSLAGEVSSPSGVAVSGVTHDVYVADTGNARVEEFSSSGVFLRAWGWGVADGLPELETCTTVCQAGIPGAGAGQFETPEFIAVDNTGGASAGDVYVADTGDNVVSKFTATGGLEGSWGSEGQLDGSSTTVGSFGSLAGIAVAPGTAGTLDVLNTATQLFEFAPDGAFTGELAFASPFELVRTARSEGLGVDGAGDFFYVNLCEAAEEFTSAGGEVGQLTPFGVLCGGSMSPSGVAVGGGGDVYVAEAGVVNHYAFTGPGSVSEPGGASCTFAPESFTGCGPSDSFGAGKLSDASGIAVDGSNDDVFVADKSADSISLFSPVVFPDVRTSGASEVKAASATLEGTVNPDGVAITDCHFDYGTTTSYGQVAACVETVGSGMSEVAVHADVTGLAPGTTYHFRLQASNSEGASFGTDAVFSTPPPPSITDAVASEESATSIDLGAQVNPGGLETSYHFEYGTSTSYGTSIPVPERSIPAGSSPVAVSVGVTGLSANTEYHWRLVAHNEAGTTASPDHTFVYDETSGGLPDNRAYEMVTPTQKNGSLIGKVPFSLPPDISDEGSHMIVSVAQCFEQSVLSCFPLRSTNRVGVPYAFTRTSTGWTSEALAPSASEFEANLFWNASETGATALFSMPTPPFGEEDFYKREPDGSFHDIGPLTPPPQGFIAALNSAQGLTASDDLSHVVLELEEPPWPESGETSLLEYAGLGSSEPLLVGVSGGQDSRSLISACLTRTGLLARDRAYPNSGMSADGRIVYFLTLGGCATGTGENTGFPAPVNGLFARVDNGEAEAHTVAIGADAAFYGNSADGLDAFFTSPDKLTGSGSEGSENLYVSECSEGCETLGEKRILVDASETAEHTPVVGGARVQGVLGFSSDASHVYFVAQGKLASNPSILGAQAVEGANNLYVFEHEQGQPTGHVAFITALPEADQAEWDSGVGNPANVTPDGRFLVFTSSADLTGDVTRTDGAEQVFRYDAQTGQLIRVSIGKNGFDDNGNAGVGNAQIVEGNKGYAGRLGGGRGDPTMSDDGSYVFFMSPIALTAGALNDVQIGIEEPSSAHPQTAYAQNVYEYHEGNVSLISDGRDTSVAPAAGCREKISATCLLGSDAAGHNVFFTTADQLVTSDTDTQLDIYDARICEPEHGNPCIASTTPPLPACLGEACHGTPPALPAPLSPGSASFNGVGNVVPVSSVVPVKKSAAQVRAEELARALRACRRERGRRRAACVRSADKRFGPVHKTKKTKITRQAKRAKRRAG